MADPSALIVDDDPDFRESLELLVQRERFATRTARSLEDARKELASGAVRRRADRPRACRTATASRGCASTRSARGTEVIVITGSTSVEAAVGALRARRARLSHQADRPRAPAAPRCSTWRARKRLKAQVGSLRGELRDLGRFGAMVGRSKPMLDVYDLVARVAPTDATVLITGESGTGKELVAQTIHELQRRARARCCCP